MDSVRKPNAWRAGYPVTEQELRAILAEHSTQELRELLSVLAALKAAGIRDVRRYTLELVGREWSWLRGAFPRGILPTDLDGFVEIRNQFLILESKSAGALMSGGQAMAFERLRATGVFTICLLSWGDSGDLDYFEIWTRTRYRRLEGVEASKEEFYRRMSLWSQWAENKKPETLSP